MKKNKIVAVLGPTNTGKTYLAIETMLSFDSGMIGFPLRLLAREVYDKIIKKIDPSKVALITGEEKIIPINAKYYLCTVESMPIDKNLEFVGIDEVQMCTDHERGHIFTERLLNLRGEKTTMFMGSYSMKSIIKKLDEDIEFDQTYEAKAWDWMVKNIKPSKKVLFWDVGIKEYDLDYIEPIKWYKSEYETIIDREMRRKHEQVKHDFF